MVDPEHKSFTDLVPSLCEALASSFDCKKAVAVSSFKAVLAAHTHFLCFLHS